MVVPSEHEARLVELATAGRFDAFASLYTRHLDAIYRYTYYRTGNAQDAEDLTEQVFIKAWEGLPHYRAVGCAFASWLYRIAHNLVIDYYRKQKSCRESIGLNETAWTTAPPESTLDAVIQAEETDRLAAAIACLPDDYQQIITLRFIESLGHAEIAGIMDKSEAACRALQHRALSALNRLLAAQQERG
jgi:RNA polymerase sigma-70 factor, ECF subfamily